MRCRVTLKIHADANGVTIVMMTFIGSEALLEDNQETLVQVQTIPKEWVSIPTLLL